MHHYYKIDDLTDIKFLVLYTINKAGRHLTESELTETIMLSANVNYFDLFDAIKYLLDTDRIYSFINESKHLSYNLCSLGKQTAIEFSMRIPLLVREYIDDNIHKMFDEEKKARQLICEPVAIKGDKYTAHLRLCDSDLPLIDLRLYTGTKDVAEDICKRFNKNSIEIYDEIIRAVFADYTAKANHGLSDDDLPEYNNQKDIENSNDNANTIAISDYQTEI